MKYYNRYFYALKAINEKYDIFWHMTNNNCDVKYRSESNYHRVENFSSKVPREFLELLEKKNYKR